MNRVLRIILGILFFIIVGVLCFFAFGSRRIPKNPEGTIGNTAGNLYNKGLFCDAGDKVYFSNAYDGNSLYKMNPDETGMEKLSNAVCDNINAGGNYVFYYQSASSAAHSFTSIFRINGVYRIQNDGRKAYCLQRVVSPAISLFDNTVLYQKYDTKEGMSLCSISIDKSKEAILSKKLVDPFNISDGKIYYAGQDSERYIYSMDAATGNSTTIYKGDAYLPQKDGNYIFFIDIIKNYQLCRYDMSTGDVITISPERIDTHNVTGSYIYYQTVGTEPALKRIRKDGTGEEMVRAGSHSNINATSRYLYFNAFNEPTPVFHTPVDGAVSVNTFTAPKGE